MTFKVDLKAIGLGALAFFAGYIVFVFATMALLATGKPPQWLILPITVLGAGLPGLLAGFAGSYFSHSRFLLHGFFAGGICVLLVFFGTVVSSPSGGGKGLLLALLAVWLGAIVGSFVRSRRGP